MQVKSTEPNQPLFPKGGEKFGAWYDKKAADAAVAFFPMYLRHTEAEWYGKPFYLSPWQEEIVRDIFGWKRTDGTRLRRQVYIEIPRKNGKTEFAAGLAILGLVADGEFGGQGYSMACDKDQAKVVFNKAATMIALSPALSKDIESYKTALYCPALQARFMPLSSKAATKHGFSPSFAIADEIHVWPDGELHDVVHKGTGARRQPLEILITTAGEPEVGYGWELHERALKVLSGDDDHVDPTFLPVIFAANPEDDWKTPEAWRRANPNLNISIKESWLEEEVAKSIGNPRLIAEFKRYHLNIWNSKTVGGINQDHWKACKIRPVSLEDLAGRRCWGGLDLSSTTDLTALTLVSPWQTGDGYDVWWHFWMPAENIRERSRNDGVRFDKWIAQGFITGTEGGVVDYDAIRAKLSGGIAHDALEGAIVSQTVDLVELAVDRWNATHLITQLMSDDVNVVQFGQGYASMSAPTKELERCLGKNILNIGENPVADWMSKNVTFITDGAENIKPAKPDRRKAKVRIDGIVTLIMALGRATAGNACDFREKGSLDSYIESLKGEA